VHDYGIIALELLKIENMIGSAKGAIEHPGTNVAHKTGLNGPILEQDWGMFHQRLTGKAINATV
jgi:putative transposase